jgi:hypothetical protein
MLDKFWLDSYRLNSVLVETNSDLIGQINKFSRLDVYRNVQRRNEDILLEHPYVQVMDILDPWERLEVSLDLVNINTLRGPLK